MVRTPVAASNITHAANNQNRGVLEPCENKRMSLEDHEYDCLVLLVVCIGLHGARILPRADNATMLMHPT